MLQSPGTQSVSDLCFVVHHVVCVNLLNKLNCNINIIFRCINTAVYCVIWHFHLHDLDLQPSSCWCLPWPPAHTCPTLSSADSTPTINSLDGSHAYRRVSSSVSVGFCLGVPQLLPHFPTFPVVVPCMSSA
jgi:hypothetical protein